MASVKFATKELELSNSDKLLFNLKLFDILKKKNLFFLNINSYETGTGKRKKNLYLTY